MNPMILSLDDFLNLQRMEERKGTMKISISISSELNRALEAMCVRTGFSKSRLIENILRENSDIGRFTSAIRSENGGFFHWKGRPEPQETKQQRYRKNCEE